MSNKASKTPEIGSLRVQLVGPVPPPYGGMALQALQLQLLMRQDGVTVDLLAHNEPFGAGLRFLERIPGVRTGLRAIRFYFRFWNRIEDKDIVHILSASWVNFLLVVFPAVWLGRFRGKRVILNYRAGDADRFFRTLGWLIRPAFQTADVVSTPSKFLAEVIDRRLGVPVSIVPNLVNLSLFRFRKRCPFRPKMLVTRHLEAIYDVECVLRAFRVIAEALPEATLWIAGTGSQEDRLRALTEEWGLKGVRFLGHVPHADLPDIYDQCDILLNGSRVDNFPGSLMEASAAGLAVVSTKGGGIPYMYDSGKNALLVEIGDWQGLAAEVMRVLQDPELGGRLAAAGVQLSKQCEWRNVRRALYGVYGSRVPEEASAEVASGANFVDAWPLDGGVLEEKRTMKVAVIGAGYWGVNLVRVFHQLGVLARICDFDRARLQKLATEYPDVQVAPSFEELLGDPGVDAVAIATPAETHYDLARKFLQAGKDVYVEKPMTLRADETLDLTTLAERSGRILMVGHLLEFHPAVTKLQELVDEGRLGRIEYIYSNRLNLGKVRREENALWSFAPHDISVILLLLKQLPIQVTATGGTYLQPNIADVTVSTMLFERGTRAHLFVSWLHPYKEQKLVVVGEKRMAVFDDVRKTDKLQLYDKRIALIDGQFVAERPTAQTVEFPPDEPLRLECQHFLECVRTRRTPKTDGHDAWRVLRVMEASQRSLSMNGEPVQLEPHRSLEVVRA